MFGSCITTHIARYGMPSWLWENDALGHSNRPTSFSINTKNKYGALRFDSSFEPDVHRSKTAHVTGFSFDLS